MANGVLFALLLWLMGSPTVFALLGATALAWVGWLGLCRAVARTVAGPRVRHPYDLLVIWAPGAQALALGSLGLWLVRGAEAGGVVYALGALLFGYEFALLVLAATEPRPVEIIVAEAR